MRSTIVRGCIQCITGIGRADDGTLLDHSISTCRRSSLCRVPCRWSNRTRFLYSRGGGSAEQLGKKFSVAQHRCSSCSIGSESSGTSLHQAVPAAPDLDFAALCRQIQQRYRPVAPAARAVRHCWWSLPPASAPNLNCSDVQVTALASTDTSGSYFIHHSNGFKQQHAEAAAGGKHLAGTPRATVCGFRARSHFSREWGAQAAYK